MKKFCIVIPIYKAPSLLERETIKNMFGKIKPTYDVYYVCPERFKDEHDVVDEYRMLPDLNTTHNITFTYFPDKYFESPSSYSQLCLLDDFYRTFSEYEYMYILQLDVWIFRDEFEYWCSIGYDYIGGPIISKGSLWQHLPNVGNGGFSLRKISTFIDICDKNGILRTSYPEIDKVWDSVEIEDKFICDTLKYIYHLEMPKVHDAFLFAWDQNANYIYENLTKRMPFGAHAIDKQIMFWREHIKQIDNDEILRYELTKVFHTLINKYGLAQAKKMIEHNRRYVEDYDTYQ